MASTIEVFLAGLALMINTVVIFILMFINAAFLGPFVSAIDHISGTIGGPLSIGDYTYLFPFIIFVLIIFEVICVIAFIVVIGRRTVYDDIQ